MRLNDTSATELLLHIYLSEFLLNNNLDINALNESGFKQLEKLQTENGLIISPKILNDLNNLIDSKINSEITELVNQKLITLIKEKEYEYYWGGTGKVEKKLKTIFKTKAGALVVKNIDETTGLRYLIVGDLRFNEVASSFPLAQEVEYDNDDNEKLKKLCEDYNLKSANSKAFVKKIYGINKIKMRNATAKTNVKTLKKVFNKLELYLDKEGLTLEQGFDKLEANGMYNILTGWDNDAFTKAIKPLLSKYVNDPKLAKFAKEFAEKTNILNSSTWKSARTPEEFNGIIGEKLAHLDIDNIMPQIEGRIIHLHSIHFIGESIDDATKKVRKDTDVSSELDLMSIIDNGDGTYDYFGLGNIKVSSKSKAGDAKKQNSSSAEVLEAHCLGKTANIDGRTVTVERIEGEIIKTGDKIDLTGKLRKMTPLSSVTVGHKDAKGDYDKKLALNLAEISTLALLLREMEQNDRK